jgi:hypothetical protein
MKKINKIASLMALGLMTLSTLSNAQDVSQVTNTDSNREIPVQVVQTETDSLTNQDEKKSLDFVGGNLEHYIIKDQDNMTRLNLFYNLPANTDVYGFVELYKNEGFLGKNMAYTPIPKVGGLGLKSEYVFSNMFNDQLRLGLEQKMMLPGGVFSCVKVLPFNVDRNGVIFEQLVTGYFLAKEINLNDKISVNLSAFGELNLINKDEEGNLKPSWGYGEVDASVGIKTKYGKFDVGVGANQYSQGSLKPKNQFRARIGYHPRR